MIALVEIKIRKENSIEFQLCWCIIDDKSFEQLKNASTEDILTVTITIHVFNLVKPPALSILRAVISDVVI